MMKLKKNKYHNFFKDEDKYPSHSLHILFFVDNEINSAIQTFRIFVLNTNVDIQEIHAFICRGELVVLV